MRKIRLNKDTEVTVDVIKYVLDLHKALCKSKPGILLPEPFPSSSSIQINIVGLKYISVIFDATIPYYSMMPIFSS